MKTPLLTALLAPLALTPACPAASLLTLSNPVANGSIVTSAGNNIRTDWSGVTAFPGDPDESLATDFSAVSMAHDSARLYIREQLYRTSNGGFFAGTQILLLDTDRSRATGYTGPAGSLAIGAEYLLEGVSLFAFTGGTQTAFSWNFITTVTYDDFPFNDHELSFTRTSIGNPAAFDFMALTDYFGGGDNYHDTAYSATGGFYSYSAIPEPSAAALLALSALLLHRRAPRQRRR